MSRPLASLDQSTWLGGLQPSEGRRAGFGSSLAYWRAGFLANWTS